MKRALNYGDLGTFLNDLRNANYNDPAIRTMLNAWRRFEKEVPDFANTGISDEATQKLAKRFGEALQHELKPVTVTSYTNNLYKAVSMLHDHYEATGSLNVPMPSASPENKHSAALTHKEHSSVLTYGDMGELLKDYRDGNPEEDNAGRWLSTYNSVISRVPFAAASEIDPERTEAILAMFERIATSAEETRAAAKDVDKDEAARLLAQPVLMLSTVRNYQFWFRHMMRNFCDVIDLPYDEVDAAERRERRLATQRAEREAEQAAEAKRAAAKAERKAAAEASAVVADEAPPIVTPEEKAPEPLPERVEEAVAVPEEKAPQVLPAMVEERDPVEESGLTEYRFLLRPGVVVTLGLPDDLTRREVARLSQWIGSFVLDAEPEAV